MCARLRSDARAATSQPQLIATVHQLLATSEHRLLRIEQLAAMLNLSSRTLERRLNALGCCYRDIVEDWRRQRAHDLLRTTTLSIADISDRLGYSEPANFGRAVRRWFNVSPGALRQRRLPSAGTTSV